MRTILINKIIKDLEEAQINLKVALLFIPIAFLSYLFHEFGHWTFGELLGYEMTYGLNSSNVKGGDVINNIDNIYISLGGPFFTILQAFLFLGIAKFSNSIYTYPVVFFAFFMRFFALSFGGFNQQDEARAALLLNVNKYLIAVIVLAILLLILFKCNRILKLKLNSFGYYFILGVLSNLSVIGVIYLGY